MVDGGSRGCDECVNDDVVVVVAVIAAVVAVVVDEEEDDVDARVSSMLEC